MPGGFGFDCINGDGLSHELSVADGRIPTRSGMNYRLLALDPYSKHMSLPVLRGIHKLVEKGAIVAGEKQTDTPILAVESAGFKKQNYKMLRDRSPSTPGCQVIVSAE